VPVLKAQLNGIEKTVNGGKKKKWLSKSSMLKENNNFRKYQRGQLVISDIFGFQEINQRP
jgi:hypothetical protein